METTPTTTPTGVGTSAKQHLGPVAAASSPHAVLRPLPMSAVTLDGSGFLGSWQLLNRAVTIGHCLDQVVASGAVDNLRRAAGAADGMFTGFWFADSDVYKILEAVGWETGRAGDAGWADRAADMVGAIERAQEADGYLNSWVQTGHGDRWASLEESHELYSAGHLIQAAIAWARATGRTELLDVAARFAALIGVDSAGVDGPLLDGHPEIEMALVELYRLTGDRRHLDLAAQMVDARGRGRFSGQRFGRAYLQDHVAVRQATEVAGHVVRQLYLAAGVTDIYLETGDQQLLEAMQRLWESAYTQRTYVTGGQGSRHRDEAYGDPYELPPDRAYTETCAAIASFMWNWRLLLATGDGRYAAEMERVLYNGIAPAVAADGQHFFYANPLQLRSGHDGSHEDAPSERPSWYSCACCPPNVARLLASLQHYVATCGPSGLQLHLLTAGRIAATLENGTQVALEVATEYPWEGEVALTVNGAGADWTLAVRIPDWCRDATIDGEPAEVASDGYVRLRRRWDAHSVVKLQLPMPVRAIRAHPRVDAVRGCVALARGPLVYCVEQADHGDAPVDDLQLCPERIHVGGPVHGLDVPVTLTGTAVVQQLPDELYADGRPDAFPGQGGSREVPVTAIPYFRWANRGANPMRVWVPLAPTGSVEDT